MPTCHSGTVSELRSRVWRNAEVVAADIALDDLDGWLGDPEVLVWLDLVDPDEAELMSLARELSLDPLAVEDAVAPGERPKASRHASHLFFTCYATAITPGEGMIALESNRVSGFVLPRALVTVRPANTGELDEALRRWEAEGLLGEGVGALVHGLLDVIVDGHFDALQALDDAVEELEDLLFSAPHPSRLIQQRVFALRKALVQTRRVVLPTREVVASLMRLWPQNGGTALSGHLEDLYDHVIRASEWSDSLREMVSSVFETNLSLQDARLNEIMKKLAGWAAIISVPTAVTGWFGQNLPYPGIQDASGLLMSVALILLGTVGLYWLFRRVDWL